MINDHFENEFLQKELNEQKLVENEINCSES